MSQLGACPDASHNNEDSNKHRGCTPSAHKAGMFKRPWPCSLCVLSVSCCCRLELIPENEAPICHLLVCVVAMVVEATVETVKVWLAFRLAQ